jgi:hypothetical protein
MTVPDAFSLTKLFISPPPRPLDPTLVQNLAGGTMTAWDPIALTNTVVVGQVTYQNLPSVSPIGLTTGLVLLQKSAAGYIIMGMLANAGDINLAPIRYRELPDDVTSVSTTLQDAGVLNFLVAGNTKYGIDGVMFYNSTSASHIAWAWSGPANMLAKWNAGGDVSTGTDDYPLFDTILDYGDANTQVSFGFGHSAVAKPTARFATTDTAGLLQLRFGCSAGTGPCVLQAGSWLRISDLGSASGATIYIKQYSCTASRSYNSDGNPIGSPDQDNNVYFGDFPDRSFGNERSMLIFPGATIRSDLAGATVLTARLWLYCIKAEEALGSFQGQAEPNTSVPSTYSPSTVGFGVNDVWTVNSWNSVDAFYLGGTSSYLNKILDGYNAIGLTPTSLGRAATGFRGYGFSVALRPYLEVTYSI